MDRKYIKPSHQEATGSGTRNIFTKEDLYRINLFKRLIDWGFSRKEAAKHVNAEGLDEYLDFVKFLVENTKDSAPRVIGFIRAGGGQGMVEAILFQEPEDISWFHDEVAKANYALIVNISEIAREVEGRIENMEG